MITIITGTNRRDSNTLKLAKVVAGLYRESGSEAQILDLKDLPSELLGPDSYKEKPTAFDPWVDQVLSSDGLVLVIPEYNGSFPGVLKLFIDHLPFPESFDRRPTCYIGLSAGGSGGVRPVEHMQQVFGYRNAYNYPVRTFIPGAYQVFGGEGELLDEDLVNRLRAQVEGFLDFVRRLKG
jgi:NAD(P)H-dependent FMN reductase